MEPFETKVVRGVTLRKDPAREACFTVADTDDQMISWPDWSDQSKRERIHRHMNNEMTTTEVAAQCLCDFPDAPWELRMELARQVWDESRHAMGLYRRLKELGGRKGEFPVANFEWAVSSYLDSAIGRITVMNRTFEAGHHGPHGVHSRRMAGERRTRRRPSSWTRSRPTKSITSASPIIGCTGCVPRTSATCSRSRKRCASWMRRRRRLRRPPGTTNLVGVSVEDVSHIGAHQRRRPAACRFHRRRDRGSAQAARPGVAGAPDRQAPDA